MAEQTNKMVPQIRFKGFSDEWLEKTLGDIAEIKTGPFGSALHAEDYVDNGEPIITTEHFKTGELPNHKNGIPQVCGQDYARLKGYMLQIGDIVFSRVGSVDINAHAKKQQEGWLFSGRVLRVRSAETVDSEYLHHELSTFRVRKSVISRAVGQTMPSINTEILKDTQIQLPAQIKEQVQIGAYIQKLDQMIGLHRRKHEKLVTLKTAMLKKMFPQNGATTPEIRFKGFSEPWEEKALGELLPITSAARVHKNEWKKSGVPFFRSSDVVSYFKGNKNEKAFISYELYRELSEKVGRVQTGDILVTGGGSIGIPYLVDSDDPLYFKDADLLWLKVRESLDSQFLYTFFSATPFRQHVKSISHIGTIGHYTIEQAKKTPIKVPPRTLEQQKIGTYFRKLDELIAQHETQMAKLKQIKSACLGKMFV